MHDIMSVRRVFLGICAGWSFAILCPLVSILWLFVVVPSVYMTYYRNPNTIFDGIDCIVKGWTKVQHQQTTDLWTAVRSRTDTEFKSN